GRRCGGGAEREKLSASHPHLWSGRLAVILFFEAPLHRQPLLPANSRGFLLRSYLPFGFRHRRSRSFLLEPGLVPRPASRRKDASLAFLESRRSSPRATVLV